MKVKQKVLYTLLQNQKQYTSGEQLAQLCGVSRTAVWKSIQTLKKDGYDIDSLTNRGYRLKAITDKLDEDLIRLYSDDYTHDMIVLESISSTNDLAKELVLKGASDGTLIVADHQSAGRGRQGHSFYSPAGSGVYFTIILRPDGNIQSLLKTTLAAGISVCEGIEACTDLQPQIKWVNDVFVNKKKVCGILTEATSDFESQQVESILVGIGINCTKDAYPPELEGIAGCLSEKGVNRNKLVAIIYISFMKWAKQLHTKALMDTYRQRSLLIGKDVIYVRNNKKYSGLVTGINDEGNLEIRNEQDKDIILQSGEVSVKHWN